MTCFETIYCGLLDGLLFINLIVVINKFSGQSMIYQFDAIIFRFISDKPVYRLITNKLNRL